MPPTFTVYRRDDGATFYRLAENAGRTRTFTIQAESKDRLDEWLKANGFLLRMPAANAHRPDAG